MSTADLEPFRSGQRTGLLLQVQGGGIRCPIVDDPDGNQIALRNPAY